MRLCKYLPTQVSDLWDFIFSADVKTAAKPTEIFDDQTVVTYVTLL